MVETNLEPLYALMTSFLREHVAPLADDLWNTRRADEDHMREIRERRGNGYRAFLGVLARYRDPAPSEGPEKPSEVEEEIQIRLGLWLSSYFLGFPLPHVWERVRHLEDVLEGYIGSGALYDRLAGDIYRAERRQRARTDKQWRAAEPRDKMAEMRVLAFTPTVLIADEDLKGNLEDISDDAGPERRAYVSALERLAGRYLRLQMWLYLQAGYPVLYAFHIGSAADALARKFDGDASRETVKREVEERYERMGGAHEKTLLYAIPDDMLKGEVFTSCTLGREDGVVADRPQHLGRLGKRAAWVRSQYLKLERDKVFGLVYGKKAAEVSERIPQDGIKTGKDEAIEALLDAWERLAEQSRILAARARAAAGGGVPPWA